MRGLLVTFRAMLVTALIVATVAPARAAASPTPQWETMGFWKATAGAAVGAWAGSKLLGWGPVLTGLSEIAHASPFAALVVRPLVPVLAGAIGAQIAGRGLAHADWAMIAAQTVGGALGTAAALLIAPGAGAIGPWIGEAAGWYGGAWLLTKWRKHLALKGTSFAASSTAVPAIRATSAAAAAYERWRTAKESGTALAARQAYAGVVTTIAH